MATLATLIAYFKAHWGAIVATTIAVATTLNQILPASSGPPWLHAILGRLASLDKDGNLSIPILQGNRTPPTEHIVLPPPIPVGVVGIDTESGAVVGIPLDVTPSVPVVLGTPKDGAK